MTFIATYLNEITGSERTEVADAIDGLLAFNILSQSAVQASHTGTTAETTLRTITVPANAMGPNGRLRITLLYTWTSSGNNKILRVRFDGTTVLQKTVTTNSQGKLQIEIANRNSLSSQVVTSGGSGGWGDNAFALTTTGINTAVAKNLTFTIELANSGDTASIESCMVEVLSGA